jgi:hypothetical protein
VWLITPKQGVSSRGAIPDQVAERLEVVIEMTHPQPELPLIRTGVVQLKIKKTQKLEKLEPTLNEEDAESVTSGQCGYF